MTTLALILAAVNLCFTAFLFHRQMQFEKRVTAYAERAVAGLQSAAAGVLKRGLIAAGVLASVMLLFRAKDENPATPPAPPAGGFGP